MVNKSTLLLGLVLVFCSPKQPPVYGMLMPESGEQQNRNEFCKGLCLACLYKLLLWTLLTAALEVGWTMGKSSKDYNLLKDTIKMKLKLPLNYLPHICTHYIRISNSHDSPKWQFLARCDLMGWLLSAEGCQLKHWIYELARQLKLCTLHFLFKILESSRLALSHLGGVVERWNKLGRVELQKCFWCEYSSDSRCSHRCGIWALGNCMIFHLSVRI